GAMSKQHDATGLLRQAETAFQPGTARRDVNQALFAFRGHEARQRLMPSSWRNCRPAACDWCLPRIGRRERAIHALPTCRTAGGAIGCYMNATGTVLIPIGPVAAGLVSVATAERKEIQRSILMRNATGGRLGLDACAGRAASFATDWRARC